AWPTPRIGLDAAERGQILHKTMELFWLKLETQARLLEMDDAHIGTQVSDAVSRALADWQAKHQDLPKRFATLEKRRFTVLIQEWLVLERQRLPFSVQSVENELQLSLAGLSIKLRQDRVDSLPDGSVAIMDYKSGKPRSLPWEDESGRPEEPQLPLYALASAQPVSALLFGKIKTGENAVIGIADTPVCIDVDRKGFDIVDAAEAPTLGQRIETWRDELTHLAQSFRAGDARVDPRKPATCQHCHLSSLCRKNEILDAGFLAAPDDGANDEQ
ncbi:MAG: PD-(D/E)XK nuclease family protein, partial [Burkholderiales bacterium]